MKKIFSRKIRGDKLVKQGFSKTYYYIIDDIFTSSF